MLMAVWVFVIAQQVDLTSVATYSAPVRKLWVDPVYGYYQQFGTTAWWSPDGRMWVDLSEPTYVAHTALKWELRKIVGQCFAFEHSVGLSRLAEPGFVAAALSSPLAGVARNAASTTRR